MKSHKLIKVLLLRQCCDKASPKPNRIMVVLWSLLSVAGVLGVLTSLLTEPTSWWWHAGTILSAGGMLSLVRYAKPINHVGRAIILFGMVLLVTLVLLEVSGLLVLTERQTWGRVELFFFNANALGATLVIWALATLITGGRWVLALLLPTVLAIAVTGSRTALIVFFVALLITVWLGPQFYRIRVFALGGGIVGALFLVILSLASQDAAGSRNLLYSSNNLSGFAWRVYRAEVSVRPAATWAPVAFRRADRLIAQAGEEHTLVFYQGVGRGDEGQPYVASVYLRADSEQALVLSSHMAEVTCQVSREWQRCITPVGYGSPDRAVQLRLEALEPGGSFDVYVWGAQLEKGEEATELQIRGQNPLAGTVASRLRPQRWFTAPEESARVATMQGAWELFMQNPWAGVGLTRFAEHYPSTETAEQADALGHAHNLPLQMLAETGLLGFLSWLIPFAGTLALAWRNHWRRLLPLATAVLLLNMVDVTYYTSGVYYVYWLTVGLIIFGDEKAVRREG